MLNNKDWKKILENVFESLLFNCRFITLSAVIFSMIASIIMFTKGCMLVIDGFHEMMKLFSIEHGFTHDVKIAPIKISSVDCFLFATVLMIFSMGMYELFVSKLDPADRTQETRPHWLNIMSLDDLKAYIGKVILMILIVLFFERMLDIEFKTASDLLYLALGIGILSFALFLTHMQKHKD